MQCVCDIKRFVGSDNIIGLWRLHENFWYAPLYGMQKISCKGKDTFTNKEIGQLGYLNAVQEPGVSITHFLDILLRQR